MFSSNRIYLFSHDDDAPLWSYEVNDDWFDPVSISADGTYIAASTNKGVVYLFSRDSGGTPLWSYDASKTGMRNSLSSVCISADGRYVAAGACGRLHLFSRDRGTPLWESGSGDITEGICMSSDGSHIAVAQGARAQLFHRDGAAPSPPDWNDPVWTFVASYDGQTTSVTCVAISEDGNRIVAGTSVRPAFSTLLLIQANCLRQIQNRACDLLSSRAQFVLL